MPWIKAKNGNAFEVEDLGLVAKLVTEGHEAFDTDPRQRGAKPWKPGADEASDDAAAAGKAGKGGKAPSGARASSKNKPAATTEATTDAADGGTGEPAQPERPADGAPAAAWAKYADAVGVSYSAGAGRDEIRDAVRATEVADPGDDPVTPPAE